MLKINSTTGNGWLQQGLWLHMRLRLLHLLWLLLLRGGSCRGRNAAHEVLTHGDSRLSGLGRVLMHLRLGCLGLLHLLGLLLLGKHLRLLLNLMLLLNLLGLLHLLILIYILLLQYMLLLELLLSIEACHHRL